MKLSLIAAMNQARVIGYQGKMPWHLPADLQHFKRLTMGKPMVMGRETFVSLGNPLPGRPHYVLSRHRKDIPGAQVFADLASALAAAQVPECCIIGGGQVFTQALPLATHLYLTFIDVDCPGDVFFPEWDRSQWLQTDEEQHHKDSKNPYDYRFTTWVRRTT